MTKQRDILKGRVKRLLREQKDMGQVGEPALQCCVTAMEAFVRDLGTKLQTQTEQQGRTVVTPVELKRVVLTSDAFAFLQRKVASIDESDAKYHKTAAKKQRTGTTTAAAAGGGRSKRSRDAAPRAAAAAASRSKKAKASAAPTPIAAPSAASPPPCAGCGASSIAIEEDDDYDESD